MLLVQLKKTDYVVKTTEIENKITDHNHDKYIATPEFHTLAVDVFNARLAQANLTTKTIILTQAVIQHQKMVYLELLN